MPIFNMVGAGNGGEDLPIGSRIIVTSDEGAVIKCAKGTTSEEQTVPASGTVTFIVHMSGIWQLTATKTGETTKTDTVTVIADDTDYNVTMRFILWIYNEGDECTAVTGGIDPNGYDYNTTYRTEGSFLKASTYAYATMPSAYPKVKSLSFINKVDLTPYSTVHMSGKYGTTDYDVSLPLDGISGQNYILVPYVNNTGTAGWFDLKIVSQKPNFSTYTLGSVQVCTAFNGQVTVSKIWLE